MKNLASLLVLFAFACNAPKVNLEDIKMYGIASPIQLNKDSTLVWIQDYFTEEVKIDSVRSDGPFEFDFLEDSTQLLVTSTGKTEQSLYNLMLSSNGIHYSVLLKSSEKEWVTFRYPVLEDVLSVRIKGEFNQWDPNKLILEQNDGMWIGRVLVGKGKYAYKYVIEKNEGSVEEDDPVNPRTEPNGMGGFNSILEIPEVPAEQRPFLTIKEKDRSEISIEASNCSGIYAYWNNFLLETKNEGSLYKVSIPSISKSLDRSQLRVYGYGSGAVSNEILIPLKKGIVIEDPAKLDIRDPHAAVMYFIMVDRFMDGDTTNNNPVDDPRILPKGNFYGGDLSGITQKIREGYFDSLGVSMLWISPISRNPDDAWGQFQDPETKFSGYHGYWPISNTSIDPHFGSKKAFKELIDEAHNHGMQVILDYVANHVHQDHSLYKSHPDWVTNRYLPDGRPNMQLWDEQRLTTWFDTFLPTLNLQDPMIAKYMVDSATYWVKEFPLDGFRHDATKHIPNNFWRLLTSELRDIAREKKVSYYQIGETYGSNELIASYLGSGLLDAQFDFNLYDKAHRAFADTLTKASGLIEALNASLKYYGSHHVMGNIIGNQDKVRFMSLADGSLPWDVDGNVYKTIGWTTNYDVKDPRAYKRMANYQAFIMTIPGIPIIYYGDEIGMPGAGDPDNRRMMRFSDLNEHELELKQEVSKLAKLRRSNMALLYGDFQWIRATEDYLVYSRTYLEDQVTVIINLHPSKTFTFNHDKDEYSVQPESFKIIEKKL